MYSFHTFFHTLCYIILKLLVICKLVWTWLFHHEFQLECPNSNICWSATQSSPLYRKFTFPYKHKVISFTQLSHKFLQSFLRGEILYERGVADWYHTQGELGMIIHTLVLVGYCWVAYLCNQMVMHYLTISLINEMYFNWNKEGGSRSPNLRHTRKKTLGIHIIW